MCNRKEYKYNWMNYLNPCEIKEGIMIGSKECEGCEYFIGNSILKEIPDKEESVSEYYSVIGEGEVICNYKEEIKKGDS